MDVLVLFIIELPLLRSLLHIFSSSASSSFDITGSVGTAFYLAHISARVGSGVFALIRGPFCYRFAYRYLRWLRFIFDSCRAFFIW